MTFCYAPQQRFLARQLEENRGVLEQIATEVAGRPMTVRAAEVAAGAAPAAQTPDDQEKSRLRATALSLCSRLAEAGGRRAGHDGASRDG